MAVLPVERLSCGAHNQNVECVARRFLVGFIIRNFVIAPARVTAGLFFEEIDQI
jgi:hypothetical protein